MGENVYQLAKFAYFSAPDVFDESHQTWTSYSC